MGSATPVGPSPGYWPYLRDSVVELSLHFLLVLRDPYVNSNFLVVG